jgi:hypothetical protein
MIGSLLLGISIQWLVDPTTDIDPVRAASLATLRRSLGASIALQRGDAKR